MGLIPSPSQPSKASALPVSIPSWGLTGFCFVLVLLGSWLWNHDFSEYTSPAALAAMSDVPEIWRGTDQNPHLWPDSLRWWHGPWIETGVSVLRPLSSYLLWSETVIGRRFGFEWVAWIGIALLAWVSWVSVCVAWTFTRHPLATVLAALLAPTARHWLMSNSAPYFWMVWYPCHHDLLMTGLLLSALLGWARWIETSRPGALWLTWAAFIAGALSKEFVYIFPIMAATVTWLWPQERERRVSTRTLTMQLEFMVASVLALFIYRWYVLPGAYNPPPLKAIHFIRRPFLYWFPMFYGYVCSYQFFQPGLALWLFSSIGLCVRFKKWHQQRKPRALWRWMPLVFVMSGIFLGSAVFFSVGEAFWFFFSPEQIGFRVPDLFLMTIMFWFMWLLVKYRREEPTLAVFGLMMLAYVPVWTYLGWHYTIAGWFVRAALWWPLLLKLVVLDVWGRQTLLRTCEGEKQRQMAITSVS